jgi:Transposase DDE domain
VAVFCLTNDRIADLWKAKGLLQQKFLAETPYDPAFTLADSFPLPACLFVRTHRCRRFKGEAAFGKDALLKQTFYGFRVQARVCWPGVITRFSAAPANAHELSVLPELTGRTSGLLLGDHNYYSPKDEARTTLRGRSGSVARRTSIARGTQGRLPGSALQPARRSRAPRCNLPDKLRPRQKTREAGCSA